MQSTPPRSRGPAPLTPDATPIGEALARSAPLASLRQRLGDSQARFDAVSGVLPALLRPHVRPGPLDDEGWTLIAANAAVAAKLRHLQPLIEDSLRRAGWPQRTLRVKVAAR